MVSRLLIEKSAKPSYFGTISFAKHLNKPQSCILTFFLKQSFFLELLNNKYVKLCKKPVTSPIVFQELVHCLVKHMIKVITSR